MQKTLPELTGSDKQIKWAESLRDKVVALAEKRGDDISEVVESRTISAWWINKFKTGSRDDSKLLKAYRGVAKDFLIKMGVIDDDAKPAKKADPAPVAVSDEPKDAPASDGDVHGAVVIFKPDVDRDQIEILLRESGLVEYADIRTFNPDHGSPVFYIP